MIALNNDNVKTVVDEMHRVSDMIAHAFLIDVICWERDIELHDYLCLADSVLTDVNAFKIIDAVEAKLTCWKCGGSGRVIAYNTIDHSDTVFEITDDEVVRCPVCGG